jgi:hypothetical protein
MRIIDQIGEFKGASHHPLEVNGENVLELSKRDPKAAYDLVFKEVERRGGLKAPREFFARQSCIGKAMAKPLPGAAEDAFLKGAVSVGGYTIYEVMPIHLKCLQVVDSPILKGEPVASEDGLSVTVKMPEFEFQDEWNLCFIFTHDPEVLYDTPKSKLKELIEGEGKRLFKPSKTNVVNSATVNGICSAIMKQLERHHSTVLRNEQELDGSVPEKKN